MTVQVGLCRTQSKTRRPVFSRRGSNGGVTGRRTQDGNIQIHGHTDVQKLTQAPATHVWAHQWYIGVKLTQAGPKLLQAVIMFFYVGAVY